MTCEWLPDCRHPAKAVAVITVTSTDNRWTAPGTVFRIPVCGTHGNAVLHWKGAKK